MPENGPEKPKTPNGEDNLDDLLEQADKKAGESPDFSLAGETGGNPYREAITPEDMRGVNPIVSGRDSVSGVFSSPETEEPQTERGEEKPKQKRYGHVGSTREMLKRTGAEKYTNLANAGNPVAIKKEFPPKQIKPEGLREGELDTFVENTLNIAGMMLTQEDMGGKNVAEFETTLREVLAGKADIEEIPEKSGVRTSVEKFMSEHGRRPLHREDARVVTTAPEPAEKTEKTEFEKRADVMKEAAEEIENNKQKNTTPQQEEPSEPARAVSKPEAESIESIESAAEQFKASLESRGEEIETEAEARGILEKVRTVGEWYKKQPLWRKLALSATLAGAGIAGAATGGGVIGGVAFLGVGVQRFLGGTSAFVGVEAILRKAKEKNSRWWNEHPTAYGAIVGIAVAAGAGRMIFDGLDEGSKWVFGEVDKEVKDIAGGTEKTPEAATVTTPPAEMPEYNPTDSRVPAVDVTPDTVGVTPEDVAPPTPTEKLPHVSEVTPDTVGVTAEDALSNESAPSAHEYIVRPGNTVWGLIEHDPRIADVMKTLSPEQRVYLVDYLKDRFAEMKPEQLRAIGIDSGNINKIFPGQRINLDSIMNNRDILDRAIDGARNLSPEEIANIRKNIS
ncbi:hypothetical protein COU17_02060 [Candidatus Kaiserbacteria bacterium CG10_big_fil_rev_8_21_14_0_10_49_17]|uniref:Uncharacterized protein n=1 Tax=Candidatus Kaiserbacteria bacterium CG10_big_fil_rev_8_21_14_0_10_49_17 TaxID=1974609 RepID=A0A2M6WEA9_9BACT|nr:MAG: hypothetical protein COU17_02060 [Candidatus Kaiserbacteria bacterium CG10_big_fil_rev_8_21_14_0_10_49_17]